MSDAKLTKTDQSVKLEIGDLINFDANTVKQVRFGLLSSETIRMQSIGEITQTSSKPDKGTIYDPAMGAVYRWDVCPTCHGDFKTCNGHFAHIHLAKPVMNPKCEIAIKHVLQCVCSYCSHALFRKTHIDMMEIKSSKKLVDRLSQLNSLAKLKKICENCGKYRVKYFIAEHRVYKVQGDEKIKMPIEFWNFLFQFIFFPEKLLHLYNFICLRFDNTVSQICHWTPNIFVDKLFRHR